MLFSTVYHGKSPDDHKQAIATFFHPVTHAADANAFIEMSLQRDRYMAAIAKEIDHIPDAGNMV